jgi:integrase/recombinase XerD
LAAVAELDGVRRVPASTRSSTSTKDHDVDQEAAMPAPPPPTNKGRRFPPEPLTRVELRQLVGAASRTTSSGIRMRAMVGVMFGAGLRVSEALDLWPRDVDTAGGKIRIQHGKGDQWRVVGIDPESGALIDHWLARRSVLELGGRHRLFTTYSSNNHGQPMSDRYVRAALARLAVKAGLDKRVHPHGLRHSLAVDLSDSGVPLRAIADQFGHASTATTDEYLRRLNPSQLVDVMTARRWQETPDG